MINARKGTRSVVCKANAFALLPLLSFRSWKFLFVLFFFMSYRWCSGVSHTWLCSGDRLRSWELKPGWPHVTPLCYHSCPHPGNIFSCQYWQRTTISFLVEGRDAYTGISKFPIPNPSLAQKSVVKRHDLVYLGTKTISIC